jgi:hypothetical protein
MRRRPVAQRMIHFAEELLPTPHPDAQSVRRAAALISASGHGCWLTRGWRGSAPDQEAAARRCLLQPGARVTRVGLVGGAVRVLTLVPSVAQLRAAAAQESGQADAARVRRQRALRAQQVHRAGASAPAPHPAPLPPHTRLQLRLRWSTHSNNRLLTVRAPREKPFS